MPPFTNSDSPIPLLARLREVFFFRQWPEADLEALVPYVRLERRRRNDILFLQGDSCRWLYVLLSGEVQMFVDHEDGRSVTLHVLYPGALVACAALFLGKAYPASARVMTGEGELLGIEGEAFLALLAQRPDLSQKMIASLAMRIGELAERLESQSAESAEQRLAQWLLDQPSHAVSGGIRAIRIAGSKKSVAAGLGMTPETFSRSLRKLASAGAIGVEGKTIRILNAGCLEDVVERA